MTKPSDHIVPGAKCVCCKTETASVLARFVARDDGMAQDGMLWGGATCWGCAEKLAKSLNAFVQPSN